MEDGRKDVLAARAHAITLMQASNDFWGRIVMPAIRSYAEAVGTDPLAATSILSAALHEHLDDVTVAAMERSVAATTEGDPVDDVTLTLDVEVVDTEGRNG